MNIVRINGKKTKIAAPKAVIMGELLRMAKLADKYTLVQERSKAMRKVIEGKDQ